MTTLVSVIIPTFQERDQLAATIATTRSDPDVEVIVVDGGSNDGTQAVARAHGDQLIEAPRGRASQLNAGAAVAHGAHLLFLHADTRLGPRAIPALREAMADPRVVGGAFKVQIGDGLGLSIITWGTNFRSRWFRLPYGDQGLFVQADAFRQLGGFQPLQIMEDVDFVRRLRRIGRLSLVDVPVRTSPRRWQTHGLVRTTFANSSALALYRLGMSPDRIRRYYDSLVPR